MWLRPIVTSLTLHEVDMMLARRHVTDSKPQTIGRIELPMVRTLTYASAEQSNLMPAKTLPIDE